MAKSQWLFVEGTRGMITSGSPYKNTSSLQQSIRFKIQNPNPVPRSKTNRAGFIHWTDPDWGIYKPAICRVEF